MPTLDAQPCGTAGRLRNIITPLHTRTSRDYLARMNDDKAACMAVANQFEADYWDGDRRFGYGGYRYDGRHRPAAQAIIDAYDLPPDARILDVGCGKGFLLYELTQLLPDATVVGLDPSQHALAHAKEEIQPHLRLHRAERPYPFADDAFDLIISINTLHNLPINDLSCALSEIDRVGKQKYIVVESFRNERELFNLQCWALTCRAFFSPEEWRWLFEKFGYTGNYEFIYFE